MTRLETLLLASLANLGGEAYTTPIRRDMEAAQGGKRVNIGWFYGAKDSLEAGGLITSRRGEEVYRHSGKPKLILTITDGGRRALAEAEAATGQRTGAGLARGIA